MRLRACLVAFLSSVVPAMASADSDEIPIAVMEFASKGGVTQEQMDALSDLLANEIQEMGNYRVIGKSDIRAALDLETQKNLLGCDDASCIAEIGGALGVRWVVVGNASKFGDTFLINIKLLDVEKIRVTKGVSKKVEGGEAALIDALRVVTREMIEGAQGEMRPEPATAPPPVTEKPVEPSPPPAPPPRKPPPVVAEAAPSSPMNTWGHVTFWVGTGCLVFGALAMSIGIVEANRYADDGKPNEERLGALDASRGWTAAMWVGTSAGVVLMATGILLWVLEPEEGVAASVAPAPDGAGAVFTLGGRW